jgi:hypothetical protein
MSRRLGKMMTLRRERLGYESASALYEAARLEAGDIPHIVTYRAIEAGTGGKPRHLTFIKIDHILGLPEGTSASVYWGDQPVTTVVGYGLIEDQEEPDEEAETQTAPWVAPVSEATNKALDGLKEAGEDELVALTELTAILKGLDRPARMRCFAYLLARFGSDGSND